MMMTAAGCAVGQTDSHQISGGFGRSPKKVNAEQVVYLSSRQSLGAAQAVAQWVRWKTINQVKSY